MKISRIFPLLAILASASIIALAQKAMPLDQKLRIAEMAINSYYVDSVNENKLVEDAINGMLNKLDPHSSYTNQEETKELNEPLEGNFSGIGIQFNMQKDTLYVVQTISGGPSEKVGIVAGDRIVSVNDTTIAGVKMKNSDIMKRLRGPKGTKVDVKVKRNGVTEPIIFRITRDNIPLYSIDASYMIDSNTGYIRVSRFASTTYKEFMQAVKDLKSKGMKQLVLDLSDNGGGYLGIATELANEFLKRGDLIVYTEGRQSPRHDEKANGTGSLKDLDVAVVVNQYSASASEILSGALQDWDRAVIVGRRTFGKGLVQRPFPFPDGSMIRLTVARYYTPSGRSIQKPYTEGREEYDKDIYNRYMHGELAHADSIHFSDSLKYSTLKNHRTIYGGGGIMPDYFVPMDTTEYSDYYRDIVAKGSLNQFVIGYIDSNRKALKSEYPNIEKFINKYEVTEPMLQGLIAQATKDSVKYNADQFNRSKQLISSIVKALVARDVFDNAAYYQTINERNDLVKAAVTIINDKKKYNELLKGNK